MPLAEKLLEVPKELIRTALDLELQEGTAIPASASVKRPRNSRLACIARKPPSLG